MSQNTDFEFIDVPVNLNGVMKVRVPRHYDKSQLQELAIDQFNKHIAQEIYLGESRNTSISFNGEAWSDTGLARVGNLEFEVRHDVALNVSGAMVGLAPPAGDFGADRLRARVTAYVSREAVYVTVRHPRNDAEKVLVAVTMSQGEPTVSVMDPDTSVDDDIEDQVPTVSVAFPGYACSIN